jgi:hypothetical protein
VLTSTESGDIRYKNDVGSEYPFPRIMAMNGDGKTSYDLAKDGVPNMIGECSVRADAHATFLGCQ